MQFRVNGTITATVSTVVEAKTKEEALEMASYKFGGVTSYCGNGGTSKLIGVSEDRETIEADGEVEWTDADLL